jgi:hypothetical protein
LLDTNWSILSVSCRFKASKNRRTTCLFCCSCVEKDGDDDDAIREQGSAGNLSILR